MVNTSANKTDQINVCYKTMNDMYKLHNNIGNIWHTCAKLYLRIMEHLLVKKAYNVIDTSRKYTKKY